MKPLADYLSQKAVQLCMGQVDDLKVIQKALDRLYPGQVHVNSLQNGVLKLTTSSASVASELRLRQTQLHQDLPASITRLHIRIG